MEERLMKFMQ